MPLPTLQMPATVPDWRVQPHDLTLGKPYTPVQMAAGQPRLRRVATAPAHSLQAQLLLTQAQATALHDWFEDTLEAGALPFAARTISPDGTRHWWHARFAAPLSWDPQATATGPMWTVSATLRLQGEPSTTAPA